ncbi:DUF503 domain-containing protein [Deinococcus maricopensis]|uniref:YlxP-like protein n=1 Tax=Deinococcus maricopensis (strain DSM 21211 / LMG 22137 / NRRL B-23946 / LB-34) TaxID=709986 RepID=E8UBG1_DEIML|nr:DUF503 domain-containing protein [Deinococcus maricopensis]ADV68400.1 protein of unknown function DUF503 [Deinococcus maricopensis DSM 21211]
MALGYVGTLTLRLEMPWVGSLKEKRALVRPIVERVKSRFPVSVARLDGLDAHDWEVVGVVTVSNDAAWVEETLRHVADFFAEQGEYRVTAEDTDVFPLGHDED